MLQIECLRDKMSPFALKLRIRQRVAPVGTDVERVARIQ